MPAKQFRRVLLTLTAGLAITAVSTALTWYQVSERDLNRTAASARETVFAIERLLNETRSAIDLASPLLMQPCTPEVRAELSRLSIGIEHIRMITIFNQNRLECSSYEGADSAREHISAADSQTLFLATDDYISPGVPVMVLRRRYGDKAITASLATQWAADALKSLNISRPLTLRTGDWVLTRDNLLVKSLQVDNRLAVHSRMYPFSVEYSGMRCIPLTLYLHEERLSLLLCALLGVAVSSALWLIISRRRTGHEELRKAIGKGEILPWYQPIVDATTGKISGVEVLARWQKPDGTILSPASFIAEAESSDLIVTLTRHLMERAARELPPLIDEQSHWHIGFNITQAHILDTAFINECMAFISAFPPDSITLTIELTERERLDSSEELKNKLKLLHALQIDIALDDFGTGYANLEYVNEIPIDVIKIDRIFVSKIGQDSAAEHLLLSLIKMVCAMNMKIVAEGVETQAQASWLREYGVNWLQGYLYSPPVPVNELKQ